MNPPSVRFPAASVPRVSFDPTDPVGRSPLLCSAEGETLSAEVLEKVGAGRFLLSAKDSRIFARSEAPLHAGDQILVRVEKLQPRIILKLLAVIKTGEADTTDACLRWYRSNPDALKTVLAQMVEKLNPNALGWMAPRIADRDLRQALQLTESLLFSKEAPGKGLFLKDYLQNLGLLLESSLGRAVREGGSKSIDRAVQNQGLKGLLMKILQALPGAGDFHGPEPEAVGLKDLAAFLEKSVRTIEAHQVVNVLSQERDQSWVIQVPFAFPEGVRTGDIFIRREDGETAGSGEGNESYEIVFFLDMDVLGRIIVEAQLRQKQIRCAIRCEEDGVRDFISENLGELKESIEAAGCRIDSVRCLAEKDLADRSEAFCRDRLFSDDAVNILA